MSVQTSSAGGVHIVPRKEALLTVENPLTPAVLVPHGQVDDITLLEHEVTWLTRVEVVQRHNLFQILRRDHSFIVQWGREGWHNPIKFPLIIK